MITRWLGWGCGFADFDRDGWLDVFLVNGHVYPEVNQLKTEAAYPQRRVVYQNLQNGRFADITDRLGIPVTTPKASRGCAFGDFDNDGDIDVVINNVHDKPDLFRLDSLNSNHWLSLKLEGTKSNRCAIGSRVRCVTGQESQYQEVRGGGSYSSQNDLRVLFGLGGARRVDRLEVRWPNGLEETWTNLEADQLFVLREGTGTPSPALAANRITGDPFLPSEPCTGCLTGILAERAGVVARKLLLPLRPHFFL